MSLWPKCSDNINPSVVSKTFESWLWQRDPETVLPGSLFQPLCLCWGWCEFFVSCLCFILISPDWMSGEISFCIVLLLKPLMNGFLRQKWERNISLAQLSPWRTHEWSASHCSTTWSQQGSVSTSLFFFCLWKHKLKVYFPVLLGWSLQNAP